MDQSYLIGVGMSSKLKHHEKNIGDLDIYYDDDYVQITVDGETAIYMPRAKENGLFELTLSLIRLIKFEGE